LYNLSYYKAENEQEVFDFMHAHPFVMLIGHGEPYPVATQVPVLIEERDGKMFLRAHIMRKTDHHLALEKDPNVLVVFTGVHSYVSASWYTNKQQGSTWNYKAVHAKGTLRFMDDENLHDLLTKLTDTFEHNPDSPSLMKHLPEKYVTTLMKAIVAFEIEVHDIEHVFKMSQNRDKESYKNIIEHLENGNVDAQGVAAIMKEKA